MLGPRSGPSASLHRAQASEARVITADHSTFRGGSRAWKASCSLQPRSRSLREWRPPQSPQPG